MQEGQKREIGQPSHLGERGEQRVCPKLTNMEFHDIQYFSGSFALRAISVSRGVFVLTKPSLLEILWT